MPTIGWFRRVAAHGAVERRVAVGEHAAVERAQPVALGVRRRRHGHDGALQREAAGRALEGGVAEGEDAAVRAGQQVPVAVVRWRRRRRRASSAVGASAGSVRPTLPKPIIPAVVVGVRRLGRSGRRAAGDVHDPTSQRAGHEHRRDGHEHHGGDERGQAGARCAGPPETPRASATAHDDDSARCTTGGEHGRLRTGYELAAQRWCRPVRRAIGAAGAAVRRPVWAVAAAPRQNGSMSTDSPTAEHPDTFGAKARPHGRRPHLRRSSTSRRRR